MATGGADLIREMARGDREAFARFYDRYSPLVYPLIRRILHDAADVVGCLHDVFWDAWLRAKTFDAARGSAEAWLVSRARELAIERMRAARRRRDALPLGNGHAPAPTAAEPLERALDRSVLSRVFERLPDPQREALELAYYGGLTQTEITARLKQPLGSVKTRLKLSLERVREMVKA
jgi:RNA polymerase sigma-70 factor (ECF subfamily)